MVGIAAESASSQVTKWAELWFGAHPSGPAQVNWNGQRIELTELIARAPQEILGARIQRQFGELPFLFKLLSIAHPLSIQAHPDKYLAEELFVRDPAHYKDDNHKPEMAIALTQTSLLYGFRSPAAIATFLEQVPEFASLVGMTQHQALRDGGAIAVRAVCEAVLRQTPERIAVACKVLYKRLTEKAELLPEEQWISRLAEMYPEGDPGLFSFFMLGLETVYPGQAIFIDANVPHAYLEGDLIECMANSDNVVRAGLTEKFKDVDTLVRMIVIPGPMFQCRVASANGAWQRYAVPANEFALEYLSGPATTINTTGGDVALLFCVEGQGSLSLNNSDQEFRAGDAFLLPAVLGEYGVAITAGRVLRVIVP